MKGGGTTTAVSGDDLIDGVKGGGTTAATTDECWLLVESAWRGRFAMTRISESHSLLLLDELSDTDFAET